MTSTSISRRSNSRFISARFGLDLLLGLGLHLLRANRRLPPRHRQQLCRVALRHPARVARDHPNHQETQARTNGAGDEKVQKKRFALENQLG